MKKYWAVRGRSRLLAKKYGRSRSPHADSGSTLEALKVADKTVGEVAADGIEAAVPFDYS
jgi:hypothetical protein